MTTTKIYKIEFDKYIYFGSTKQRYLSRRQSRHNHNLKHNPIQKLYRVARENEVSKLICELICECNEEERLLKENELIQSNTDKIILNDRLAFCDAERKKEINRKYAQSEKGKLSKRNCDKRYNEKHKDKILQNKREYYIKNKDKWKKQK